MPPGAEPIAPVQPIVPVKSVRLRVLLDVIDARDVQETRGIGILGRPQRAWDRTHEQDDQIAPAPRELIESLRVERGAGAEHELVAGADREGRGLAGAGEVRFRAEVDALAVGEQEQQQQTDRQAAKQGGPEPRTARAHEVPHGRHADERDEGRPAARPEQPVAEQRQQADADPHEVGGAQAPAAAREEQQERAREAELERLPHVAGIGPEEAIGASVDGVEPARMDDLVDPGDQAQGRERPGRVGEAHPGRVRETHGRRMAMRSRLRGLPTTRRRQGSGRPGARASGHSRGRPGRDSRGARPAGSARG